MTKKVEKRVPDIRFKGFTDDWEQRKLGELFKERVDKSGNGQLLSVSISQGVKPFDESIRKNNSSKDKHNYKVVKTNDIAYNSMRMWQGAEGRANIQGIVSPAYTVLTPNSNVNSLFFELLFKTSKMLYIFRSHSQGLTSDTWNLKYPLLKDIYVNSPFICEQEKISKLLVQVEKLLSLQQKKLEQLKQFKKAMLQQIFPDKDGKLNIRFNGFNDAWEQRKLGEVVDVMSGQDYKHLDKGNIPVYGTGGYMLSVNKALSETEDAIGIGRKGTIDKPYLLKAPFWTVDTLFYSVPKKYYDLYFVNYIFQRIQWRKYDESTGVPSLSKKTINSVSVSIPKYDEQKQIGSYLSKFDSLIALHQRRGDHLKLLKKFLLQKMFI